MSFALPWTDTGGCGGIWSNPGAPTTSTAHIRVVLSEVQFDSTGFGNKKPFNAFVKKLQSALSKKGKEVQIVIDQPAFYLENEDRIEVAHEEITFPPAPTIMIAKNALRLAVSQVGRGDATYWIRRGQVVITSTEKAQSAGIFDSELRVNCKKRPLVEVLDELAEISGVSIIVDQRVRKKAQTIVAARFDGVKLRAVVPLLADAAELKSVEIGNVIYVTSPENARQFKELKLRPFICERAEITQKERKLRDAIEDFALGNVVFDSRILAKTNIRINAKWINMLEWDVALCILTDMAGLRHIVRGGIVYVTSPANAEKWMQDTVREQPPEKNQDELLIARIKAAVAEKIPIDKVEAHVRQKAALNTARNKDGLLRGGLDDDLLEKTKMPKTSQANYVIFWDRPIKSPHHTRVVGILYAKDGTMEVFFGVVLPP